MFSSKYIFSLVLSLLLAPSVLSAKPINVVASTQSLASITEYIGGKHVNVRALAVGHVDLHFFEPKPSMVMKVAQADMVIKIGMSFDAFVDAIVEAANNPGVFPGSAGYVDASYGVPKLEVPQGPITMSMGDIHEQGNPHYYLDPRNAVHIATNILNSLKALDPDHKDYYDARFEDFSKELEKRFVVWDKKKSKTNGKVAISYHRSWSYLFDYLGLQLLTTIEPLPGLPPTPRHIKFLLEDVIKETVDYIVIADIYNPKEAKRIQKETGAPLLMLPVTLDHRSKKRGYFEFIDGLISAF